MRAASAQLASPSPSPSQATRAAAWTTLACLAAWGVALVLLYPGLISPDFAYQWAQAVQQRIPLNDLHPYVHTLLIAAVTRFRATPAAVTVTHQLLLAGATYLALHALERHGASTRFVVATGLAIGLNPLTVLYAVSLWKDIPYGAAVLAASALCAEVALTRGAWLAPWRNRIALAAAVLGIAALRHNGPAPALATLAALLVLCPRRREAGTVAAAVLAGFLLLKGPLQRAIGVDEAPLRFLASQQMMHQVAAIVHAGRPIEPAQADVFRRIMPLADWGRQYVPTSVMPLVFFPGADRAFFDDPARTAAFRRTWWAVVRANPGVVARHMSRVSALVWRLREPDGTYVLPDEGLRSTDLGLPLLGPPPSLARAGAAVVPGFLHATRWRVVGPFLYRGAPWLLVLLLAGCALAWTRRRPALLLPIVPAAGNAASLLLLAVAQDTRYIWSHILVAPLAVGLLFTRAPDRAAAAAPGNGPSTGRTSS